MNLQTHQFMDKLKDAIVICGSNGHIHYCNASFSLLSGYTPEQLSGQPLDTCLNLQAPWTPDFSGPAQDISVTHKMGYSFPAVMECCQGQDNESILVCHPETAGETTHYSALLHTVQDAITLVDEEGKIIDVNRTLCQLLGYRREDLIGENIDLYFNEARDQLHASNILQRLQQRGFTEAQDQYYLNSRGQAVHVAFRLFRENCPVTGKMQFWLIARTNIETTDLVAELKASEKIFRTLFDSSFDAIAYFRNDDTCERANKAFEQLIGYSAEELESLTYQDYTVSGWEDTDRMLSRQVRERGYSDVFEKEFRHRDGHTIPVSLRASAQYNAEGKIVGCWLIYRDISNNKRILAELEQSKQLLEQTGRLAKIGGWSYYPETHQIAFTHEVSRILGLPKNTSNLLEDILTMFSQESRSEIKASVEVTLLLRTPFDIEVLYLGFKTPRWMRLTGRMKSTETGDQIFGVIQDIHDYKNTERLLHDSKKQMEHLAFHDSLTELPNRQLFNDRLRLAIFRAERNQTPLSVLLLDIDQFHRINSTLGHSNGDRFLLEIVRVLRTCIRKEDSLARVGGDEFAILLERCGEEDAQRISGQLINRLALPGQIRTHRIPFSLSAGLATYPVHHTDTTGLLKAADHALSLAKQSGGNQVRSAQPVKPD